MKQFPLYGALPLMAMVSLTSCIDNEYDLDDIDTTTEIKVKDLVLPVNLDEVKLGDIISIKEGSELNEVTINGKSFYAVNKSGDFSSDDIVIPGFSAPAPVINPLSLNFQPAVPANAPQTRAEGLSLSFTYPAPGTEPSVTNLNYTATGIDNAIIELTDINVQLFQAAVTFNVGAQLAGIADFYLQDVEVVLPKGLVFTPSANTTSVSINEQGNLAVTEWKFDSDGNASILLQVSGIKDMAANGYVIDSNRNLVIDQEIYVKKGTIKADVNNIADLVNLSGDINIGVDFSFSDLVAESVSGKIRYQVDGIDIAPVEINDIPDFLSQDGTNLVLANPQIYLKLNNPLSDFNLGYQSGVSITPYRDGVAGTPLELNANAELGGQKVFQIAALDSPTATTDLVLSPENPTLVPDGFVNPKHVAFSALSNVIAGNGIPESLKINLVNPEVYEQRVNNFLLGNTLPGVAGKWEFLAPLAMKAGSDSKIIYTDTKDGWNDDDVDAITITELTLSMTADSKLPLTAILEGTPIDKSGNAIQGVTVEGATIKGMTDGQEVKIRVTGKVTHLDGFRFTATVTPEADEALSPEQTLVLKNIRAKVSGSYTKEL